MKITEIKKYRFEDGGTVEFIPVKDVPGYSHRVAINGVLVKSWLGNNFNPNKRQAQFFYKWKAM